MSVDKCQNEDCECGDTLWPGRYVYVCEQENTSDAYSAMVHQSTQRKSVVIDNCVYNTYTYVPYSSKSIPYPSNGYINIYNDEPVPVLVQFSLPKVEIAKTDTIMRLRHKNAPNSGTFKISHVLKRDNTPLIVEIEYIKRDKRDCNLTSDVSAEWYIYDFTEINVSVGETKKKKRKKKKKEPDPEPVTRYVPPHKRTPLMPTVDMVKMVHDLVHNDHARDQGCQTDITMVNYESWYDYDSLTSDNDLYPEPELDLPDLVDCERRLGPLSAYHEHKYSFNYNN
jgi:hypothetical protein